MNENVKSYLMLVRCYYYMREMDDEIYMDADDMMSLFKIISSHQLLTPSHLSHYRDKCDECFMSDDYFKLLDEMMDDVCGWMSVMECDELSNYNTHIIKSLYLIFLKIRDLKELNEFDMMRDEIVKMFDVLSNPSQKNFYNDLSEMGLLSDEFDGVMMYDLSTSYISYELEINKVFFN